MVFAGPHAQVLPRADDGGVAALADADVRDVDAVDQAAAVGVAGAADKAFSQLSDDTFRDPVFLNLLGRAFLWSAGKLN